jgi:hypothetical protein
LGPADNPWPQLAADRLEYNFCEVVSRTEDVTIVRGIYNDITVLTNKHGQPELWFQNIEMATAFAYMALENDQQFFGWYESKLTMSFLTMILKEACDKHIFTLDDLYTIGRIRHNILEQIIRKRKGETGFKAWHKKVLNKALFRTFLCHALKPVSPFLLRIICSKILCRILPMV